MGLLWGDCYYRLLWGDDIQKGAIVDKQNFLIRNRPIQQFGQHFFS